LTPGRGAGPAIDAEFVGREAELDQLRAACADARRGRGGLVLVSGEPGVGKTRLLEAFCDETVDGTTAALWGRACEQVGAPAYWPWAQVVRAWLREHGHDAFCAAAGPGAAEIAKVVPELAKDADRRDDESSENRRFALFDAIASFLRAGAVDRTLIVVLDDVHAADEPSLLLLEHAAHALRDARVPSIER